MKKMLILATGEVEEFDDSYAQRLWEFGKAEYVAEKAKKEEKPQVEVTVTDKVPDVEKPAEEAPKSAKGAKGKKTK